MKKSFKLFGSLLLASAMLLSACGSQAKEEKKEVSNAETKEASTVDLKAKIDLASIKGEGDRLDKILKDGVISVATSPDYAPFEFQDISSGEAEYVGSDIELAKYIADQLGVKLEIKAMDFDTVKAAVTTGQADIAISGLAYTDERAESMELSKFFNTDDKSGQGLLVLKEKAGALNKAEAFDGKKIAAQNGSVQFDVTVAQLPKAECMLITNINDAIMMLKTGEVDGVALDIANAEMYANTYDDMVVSDFVFDYKNEGMVAGIMKGETKLLNAVNTIIDDVNNKGLYKQWREEAIELAKKLGVEVDE